MVAADLPWSIHLQDAEVWQRERTLLMVEVQSTDRFATLEASLPRIDGVDAQAIPASNEASADGKRILRIGWALFPHTPGRQAIQLPTIRYQLNGREAAQWQPPLQTLEVRALPPYLPPTLPVGKVDIESSIEPSGWLQSDHLAYWHVSLSSDAVTTAQFPPILKQVQVAQGVEVFPAKVAQPTQGGGAFQLEYRIPFKPQGNGRLALPTLHWHWFDPASGRLEQVQHPPPHPWVLGWLWRSALGLVIGVILLAGGWVLGKIASKHWRQWLAKQRVLQALQGNTDPQAVRQAMRECAVAHGWPDNFSSAQWLQRWEQVYGKSQPVRQSLILLDAAAWRGAGGE
ncbi:MAG: BatD family protein [Gammaproteobacteria bacterium]|nr:BatD family protein [Gammaproteobacteria bacterium]MBU1724768.1 BatD family protein [Gammaproteobacteria bacterium]MBU2005775.1 BatD family protein [Gammaproteobacteria bacterium]